MYDDHSADDTSEQPIEEIWALAQAVSRGDTLELNNYECTFTVIEIIEAGADGDFTEINLDPASADLDSPVALMVSTAAVDAPVLIDPDTGTPTDVTTLTPVGETLIATARVEQLYEGIDTDRPPASRDGASFQEVNNVDETEHDIVGTCYCGGLVVKQEGRAICADCGTWTWMAQWQALSDESIQQGPEGDNESPSGDQITFDNF